MLTRARVTKAELQANPDPLRTAAVIKTIVSVPKDGLVTHTSE